MDELKTELAAVLSKTPPPRDDGKPRLAADRVFTLKGIGTVVTGTLSGGVLEKGQHVVLQPGARAARVRSLQSHNQGIDLASPGARTAVSLTDASREEVTRGDIITLPKLGEAADTVDVQLLRSANSPRRAMKNNALVRVHHGSGNEPARLVLMEGKTVGPGERVLAQFRFEQPVYMLAGDRLVVRDWSETVTLAGGLVIDPRARRRGFRRPAQRELLEKCAGSTRPSVWMAAFLKRDGAVKRASLLRQSRFGESDVAVALESEDVLAIGEWVADAGRWRDARAFLAAIIDAEHKAHPERPGMALDALRARAQESLPEGVVPALLEELCANGFRREGTVMARASHTLELPAAMRAGADTLRAALRVKPMEPPARKDLGDAKALRFLIDAGEAVEVSRELVMDAGAFNNAVDRVRQRLQQGGARASELREALGTSRRVIIPLLEKLDRDRVTVRQGDVRVLRVSG
jgi:selenocysteine-specific elongation factor